VPLHLICQELNSLVPPRPVRDHGRATGLIERHRSIDAPPFLWTFLVGTTQDDGSVSAVHDIYRVFTGDDVAYSSIQQWITPELTDLLVGLVDYVSVELGQTESSLGGRFSRFRDVFIPDATICTLSPNSVDDFPGFGDDHAGAKLHVVESLASVAPFLDSITSARTQETTQLEISQWVEDSLTMFDLGHLDYGRLGRIDDNDGWFVCRLNADANPHVIEELRICRGNSIDLSGKHHQEVLPDLYRQIIDVTATVGADQDDPHFPPTSGLSVCVTKTTRTRPPIAMTLTLTTSTTSTRRISRPRRSRRENSRRCTATDGASKPSSRNARRSSDWR
jgi:hypothetical protein